MEPLDHIDELPLPLKVIARGFQTAAADMTPEIFHCSPEEVVNVLDEDDLVFQIIIDKTYESYYIVAVGEKDRVVQSETIVHNPFHVQRATMYFAAVSSDWIYAMKNEVNNDKQMYGEPVEWDAEAERYDTPFQYGG
jgi:hypothetical protein